MVATVSSRSPLRVFDRHGDGRSAGLVPEISRFLGIVIGMFYREHGVPHFHAVYGEHKITVETNRALFEVRFRPERSALYLNGLSFTSQNCWQTGSGRVSAIRSSESNRWSKHDAL